MIITLSELRQLLPHYVRLHIPVILNGPTGVGKTATVEKVAREMGYEVLNIRLARELPEQIGGIPVIDEKEKAFRRYLQVTYKVMFEKPTMVFFDEYNRSHVWQRNAVMSLFYERRIDDKVLHPDSNVVLAVNLGEGYQTDEIDLAVIARAAVLNIRYDMLSHVEFVNAEYGDVAPLVLPKMEEIFEKIPSQVVELQPARSTRNLEFAYKVIRYCMQNSLDREMMRKLLLGVVPADIVNLIEFELDMTLVKKILDGSWRGDKSFIEKNKKQFPAILNYFKLKRYEDKQQLLNVLEFAYAYYNTENYRDSLLPFIKVVNMIGENKKLFVQLYTQLPDSNAIKKMIKETIKQEASF
mgnify:CR=1 FL=1